MSCHKKNSNFLCKKFLFFFHIVKDNKAKDEINSAFSNTIISLFLLIPLWTILFIITLYMYLNISIVFIIFGFLISYIFHFNSEVIHECKISKYIINLAYKMCLLFISPHRLKYEYKKHNINSLPNDDRHINNSNNNNNSEYKKELGKLIIKSNRVELITSSVIFIVYYLLNPYIYQFRFGFVLIFLPIIFRTISRSNEIIIAFTNDCFSKKSTSGIVSQERIILAISSLVENIFNYAVCYHIISIIDNSSKYLCLWQAFARSFETNFFQNIKLNMEVTYPDPLSMLTILQFITSICLIIFSVAIYASGNKD